MPDGKEPRIATLTDGKKYRVRVKRKKTWWERNRRNVVWAIVGLAVLWVLSGVWVGVRGVMAKSDLEKAVPGLEKLQNQITQRDFDGAQRSLSTVRDQTKSAHDLTSDPVWRAWETTPFLGNNLTAFRKLADATHRTTDSGIPPLLDAAKQLNPDSFKPQNGQIDLAALNQAVPNLTKANNAVSRASQDVKSIDTNNTIAPIREAVTQVDHKLSSAASTLQVTTNLGTLLPPMLGGEGDRTYLLLFQNNAEIRATGGIPGALAEVKASNGRVEMTRQASSADFPRYSEPVLPLTAEQKVIYTNRLGTYIQNVNMTPDFPTSAKLAREMWKRQFSTEVDGVIAIDPVALQQLVKATGPIKLPDGQELNGENTARVLLSEAYTRYENPQDQDKFFADAAKAVFDSVSQGNLNATNLASAFEAASNEGRLFIWSSHNDEQDILSQSSISGILPETNVPDNVIGVFFNDGTGAKMDYYLTEKVSVESNVCGTDARRYYRTTVTLSNTLKPDQVDSLPSYVSGDNAYGVPQGEIRTNTHVYLQPDSIIRKMTAANSQRTPWSALDSKHPVASTTIQLKPGESKTFVVESDTPGLGDEPRVRMTPGLNSPDVTVSKLDCSSIS